MHAVTPFLFSQKSSQQYYSFFTTLTKCNDTDWYCYKWNTDQLILVISFNDPTFKVYWEVTFWNAAFAFQRIHPANLTSI